jgi:hypothetical protein
LRRGGNETFTLRLFTGKLTRPADRLSLLPRRHFRWFLVKSSSLHFPEDPLALHLFLEHSEGLIDIVVANEYLQGIIPFPIVCTATPRLSAGTGSNSVGLRDDGSDAETGRSGQGYDKDGEPHWALHCLQAGALIGLSVTGACIINFDR